MNENNKTIAFAAVAILALVVAIATRPSAPVLEEPLGGDLFQEFDVLKATEIQIVTFDEATGDSNSFSVKQLESGAWAIPSHASYPANAQSQMEKAAKSIVGLLKGPIVTNESKDHGTYGVRDPKKSEASDKGVGTLVRLANRNGETLAELIVGKSVRNSTGVRYVRKPAEDRVYQVEVDISGLSSNFEDWIERDFLGLDANSVKSITLDNHSMKSFVVNTVLGPQTRRKPEPGEKLALAFDSTATGDKKKWTLTGAKLSDEKELDQEKLDALKTAIDELRIIDVDAKAELVAGFLKSGKDEFGAKEVLDLKRDPSGQVYKAGFQATATEIEDKGFFFASNEKQTGIRLLSNLGQVFVDMSDGVRYVLRFGEITGKKADEAKSRYIMVVAQVNEAGLGELKLKELPKLPEGVTEKDLEEKKEDPKKDDEKKDDAAKKDEKKDDKAKAAEEKKAKAIAEYKQVKAENEQAQKSRATQIEAAKKKATELNEKFGPWYYVISDENFKKIRLERKDIVKVNVAFVNKQKGEKFLAENKKVKDVKATKSGLQYQVLKAGTGKKPGPKAEVEVKYKGTLLNGKVFDETKGDKTATFRLDSVVKGWTEGLQLMKEGAKYKMFIPSDMAYGTKGSGANIGPNETLIFEIELIKITDPGTPDEKAAFK